MYGQMKRLDPNVSGSGANKYAVGSRVYNGSSPSPQAGAGGVNPAGYIDRDRQAAVKRNMLLQQAANPTYNRGY